MCVGEYLSRILSFYFRVGFIWANGQEKEFPFNSS